jgi:opacity protein-like surface antigen
MARKHWAMALLALLLVPSAGQADYLFTPAVSYPFGGDTLGRKHVAWTGGIAWLDDEGFGVEADVSVAPQFFNGNKADFTGTGNVLSLMANVLLTGTPDAAVVPYVTGGAGLMQMRVTSDGGTFTSTTREAGLNAGVGLFAFPAPRVGIRADLRYLRSFQDQIPSWTRGVDVDIAPGAFDFWRVSAGVTVRFVD